MALKGLKRSFAEAIVAAKPLKISNREAALLVGSKENSASASGSRWAADAEVKAYILAHWPDYYDAGKAANAAKAAAQQNELPLLHIHDILAWLDEQPAESEAFRQLAAAVYQRQPPQLQPAAIKNWIQQQDSSSETFQELVHAVCRQMGVSLDPMKHWDSVLLNPYATAKEKAQAAADKAKYTLAKPAAQSKKDSALEQARQLRAARTDDLFGEPQSQHISGNTEFKGKVPIWN